MAVTTQVYGVDTVVNATASAVANLVTAINDGERLGTGVIMTEDMHRAKIDVDQLDNIIIIITLKTTRYAIYREHMHHTHSIVYKLKKHSIII